MPFFLCTLVSGPFLRFRVVRYEPFALGLEGAALEAVILALREWSGGVLVATGATDQTTLSGWERWSLDSEACQA